MKTDQDKFISFFIEMGVSFDIWESNQYIVISVSGCNYCFDKKTEKFLGTEHDETGYFTEAGKRK